MHAIVKAVLDVEYPLLLARAERAGWQCTLDGDTGVLCVRMAHSNARDVYVLRGDLTSYNRIPPAWTFAEPDTGLVGTYRAFPARSSARAGVSPVFTEFRTRGDGRLFPIICLPCNRLCFKEETGLHGEWTYANWMAVQPQYTTLVEMVERIHMDMQASTGPWVPRT